MTQNPNITIPLIANHPPQCGLVTAKLSWECGYPHQGGAELDSTFYVTGSAARFQIYLVDGIESFRGNEFEGGQWAQYYQQ